MYHPHPSSALIDQFAHRPFQGVAPGESAFLFVGLDANYAADLADRPFFERILEYHEDGVGFWQRNLVHHPFLLPEYRGDGRRYHRNFARIGFQPQHAPLVSFAELLHVPTVGRSALEPQDLNRAHLEWLNDAILGGRPKRTFLSVRVFDLMRASGAFGWLPRELPRGQTLPVIHGDASRSVHLHLHFSNYGKFQARLDAEATAIRSLLPADW